MNAFRRIVRGGAPGSLIDPDWRSHIANGDAEFAMRVRKSDLIHVVSLQS
jgi:hypothetical protein